MCLTSMYTLTVTHWTTDDNHDTATLRQRNVTAMLSELETSGAPTTALCRGAPCRSLGVALSVCTHARAAACCASHTSRRRRWRCPTAERLRRATQLSGGRGPCRWQCNTMLPGTKSAKASVHRQSRPARRLLAADRRRYGHLGPRSAGIVAIHAWSGLVFAGLRRSVGFWAERPLIHWISHNSTMSTTLLLARRVVF